MSKYRINSNDLVNTLEIGKLSNVLNIMNIDDELLISVDENEIEDSSIIFDTLQKNGFSYVTYESNKDGKYNIIARR